MPNTKSISGLLASLLLSYTNFSYAEAGQNEYQKWLQQNQKEFQAYIDEQDKAFADFLKQQWTDHDVKPERKRDTTPKPKVLPKAPEPVIAEKPVKTPKPRDVAKPKERAKPIDSPETSRKPIPEKEIVKTTKPPFQPPRIKPQPVKLKPVPVKGKTVQFTFLGHKVTLPKLDTRNLQLSKLSGPALSDAWIQLAKTKFKPVVEGLESTSKQLKLDDWATSLLTDRYTETLGLGNNRQQMVNWFLLVKQGFDTRVAYTSGQLYLLMNVAQPLYGQTFFNKSGKRYYVVDLGQRRPVKVSRVRTYDKQHNSASKAVYVDLQTPPAYTGRSKTRALTAKVNGEELNVSVPYSDSYVKLLDYYPQMDMVHYFRAELPAETKQSLITQLKPKLEGLNEVESINTILGFVQKSLAYQTDQQQFNYENYLFPSETLHYPYADCEDRSVLFAWLIKNLMGNKVVGLQYDGHIATAVKLKSKAAGDTVNVNGNQYVMADPTYINAKLGMTMPQFKTARPGIIKF